VRIIITVICCFIVLSTSAQKFKNADKYIEFVNKQQQNVTKAFLKYSKSISYVSKKNTTKKIQGNYNKLIAEINDAQKNIDSMPVFKIDSTHRDSVYRNSTSAYFKQYALLLSNTYNSVATLQATAEQSYSNMEVFLQTKAGADTKLKKLNELFYANTLKFANDNKIQDSTRKDIATKTIDEVLATEIYFKQVYLIFFKSYRQEQDIQNAIERKDVNDLKNSTKSLAKSAQNGEVSLDAMAPFNKDKSLITDCKDVLEFYKKETDEKIDPITDYFTAAQEFETVRSTFNRKQGHSGGEVKAYKKEVSKFNKALKKYNKTMNGVYIKRKGVLKKWDNAVHSFIDKNMPTL